MALGRYMMREFTDWGGVGRENHINAAFGHKPELATPVYIRLLEQKHGKNLEAFLRQFPIQYFDEDTEIYWKLIGSARKNIPLYEVRDITGAPISTADPTLLVGRNLEPFYLVFPQAWFFDGEVLHGELNELYPVRILGDVKMEGDLAVYKVQMHGNMAGMPVEQLTAGKRFNALYAPVEKEFSRKVGDVHFAAPLEMRNEFTTIRIQHKEPGSMIDKKLMIPLPMIDESGKKRVVNYWINMCSVAA